jgi:hypothetical protein
LTIAPGVQIDAFYDLPFHIRDDYLGIYRIFRKVIADKGVAGVRVRIILLQVSD